MSCTRRGRGRSRVEGAAGGSGWRRWWSHTARRKQGRRSSRIGRRHWTRRRLRPRDFRRRGTGQRAGPRRGREGEGRRKVRRSGRSPGGRLAMGRASAHARGGRSGGIARWKEGKGDRARQHAHGLLAARGSSRRGHGNERGRLGLGLALLAGWPWALGGKRLGLGGRSAWLGCRPLLGLVLSHSYTP